MDGGGRRKKVRTWCFVWFLITFESSSSFICMSYTLWL